MIDNVIYTPYRYDDPPHSNFQSTKTHPPTGHLIDIGISSETEGQTTPTPSNPNARRKGRSKFLVLQDTLSDIFVFSYGVVVIWGMTEVQERRFLSSLWVFD